MNKTSPQDQSALRSRRDKRPAGKGPAAAVAGRKAKLPEFIAPQLATLVDQVPRGKGWLHEIKLDGYRMLCRVDNGRVRLLTRNRQDWTGRMDSLVRAAAALPLAQALLDGEVVAVGANGATDFQLLQNSLSSGLQTNLVYYVFDVLHLDGRDLTSLPLLARKEALTEILSVKTGSSPLRYSEHWPGEGERLYQEACRAGFEGVISKLADQPYRPGRSRDWLKTKCVQNQEFVIGGFTEPAGSRTGLGALLVGVHDERGRLVYAGKVGTGFTRQSLSELRRRLGALETPSAPFINPPKGAEARGVHWVRPELVGAVAFTQWTQDNLLRHPSFQGLREDKAAQAVTRERSAKPRGSG